MVRGLKDKVSKGSYVVRAGILDRMVENKIYYKFLEYGSKVKAEEEARKEKKKEEEDKLASNYSSKNNLFGESLSKDQIQPEDIEAGKGDQDEDKDKEDQGKDKGEEMNLFSQSDSEDEHNSPHVKFKIKLPEHDEADEQRRANFTAKMQSFLPPKQQKALERSKT